MKPQGRKVRQSAPGNAGQHAGIQIVGVGDAHDRQPGPRPHRPLKQVVQHLWRLGMQYKLISTAVAFRHGTQAQPHTKPRDRCWYSPGHTNSATGPSRVTPLPSWHA